MTPFLPPTLAAWLCLDMHRACAQGGEDMPTFNVSYKPQKISPKFEGTVRQLLHKKIRDSYLHPQVMRGQPRGAAPS
jgi:translation initiation factor RLI1